MRYVLPLLALAAAAMPAIATANPGDRVVTVRVAYTPAEIASAEGRVALLQRIEAKLREACRVEALGRYGQTRNVTDEVCVADARAVAAAEIEQAFAAETRKARTFAAN